MIIRKWLLLTFCLVAFAAGHASVNTADTLTASKVFAEIPLEVLDMLRPSTRLDMLDYYTQADSIVTVQNALGGESRLESVAPDYLKVSVTPISTLEIKLLPLGKSTLVMTLYTVWNDSLLTSQDSTQSNYGLPNAEAVISAVADTEIKLFDANLKPLDKEKYLKAPTLKDFFDLRGSGITGDELREKIPFDAILYSTGPGDTSLSATLTTIEAISQEDRDLLKPLLRNPLQSRWKSKFQFN